MLRGEKKKECTACGALKPIDDFYDKDVSAGTKRPACKSCHSISYKERRAGKKSRSTARSKESKASEKMRRRYGIVKDDYQSMFDSQEGKCANKQCANILVNHNKSLFVDHSHITGNVRGLLCQHCNFALGGVDDRVETLVGLIDYLNMYDGTSHGGKVATAYTGEWTNA